MIIITEDNASMKVEFNLCKLKDITTRGKRQGFYQVGVIARNTIKDNIMKSPRSGRVERFRGRLRRASMPGESFFNKTGAAKNTLGFDVRGGEELEFGFRANQATIYTKILEVAKNRPTLEIASKATVGKAQILMEKELKKAHDEGFK